MSEEQTSKVPASLQRRVTVEDDWVYDLDDDSIDDAEWEILGPPGSQRPDWEELENDDDESSSVDLDADEQLRDGAQPETAAAAKHVEAEKTTESPDLFGDDDPVWLKSVIEHVEKIESTTPGIAGNDGSHSAEPKRDAPLSTDDSSRNRSLAAEIESSSDEQELAPMSPWTLIKQPPAKGTTKDYALSLDDSPIVTTKTPKTLHPIFSNAKGRQAAVPTSDNRLNRKSAKNAPNSSNVRSSKKARLSVSSPQMQQKTLTQAFGSVLSSPAPRAFQDTEDTWFLRGGPRLFKKGEVFRNTTETDLKGYLYTVDECMYHQRVKYAVSTNGAYMFLKDTFIGEDNARRLIENGSGEDFEIVRCLQSNMFTDRVPSKTKKCISLSLLDEKVDIPKNPDPFLIYDSSSTNKKMSKAWRVAYMSRNMLNPANWIHCEIPKGHEPTVLDLFAGCGGMHLGFERAGFNRKSYLVEKEGNAVATLHANFPEAQIYDETVENFLECCKDNRPGYPKPEDIDHVHASPPCQGFSGSNRNMVPTQNDIENNNRSFLFVDAVKYFRPKTASFENVPGMLMPRTEQYLKKIMAELLKIGYQSRIEKPLASDFGDPQERRRVILCASRFDEYLPDPPTPVSPDKRRKIKHVLEDLIDVEPTPGSGRALTSRGKVVTQHSSEGGLDLKSENEHLSQCKDGYATTVRRQTNIKHQKHERLITTRERARLQSFPDTFWFSGAPTQQRNQIGNAVPVCLATCIAETISAAHCKKLRTRG